MLYTKLNEEVKAAAMAMPNVNTYTEGDVYVNWHNGIKYAAVNMGLESAERTDNTIVHNVVLYYADRPVKDDSNKISIYDDGVNVLLSILDILPDDITYLTPITYTQFEQQFEDVLDGVYARVRFETEFEQGHCGILDEDAEEPTIDIKGNGRYNVRKFTYADVSVAPAYPEVKTQDKETTVMAYVDGSYTIFPDTGYDAMSKATVQIQTYKEEKTVNISTNGTTVVTPSVNGKAITKVTINTSIATEVEPLYVKIQPYQRDLSKYVQNYTYEEWQEIKKKINKGNRNVRFYETDKNDCWTIGFYNDMRVFAFKSAIYNEEGTQIETYALYPWQAGINIDMQNVEISYVPLRLWYMSDDDKEINVEYTENGQYTVKSDRYDYGFAIGKVNINVNVKDDTDTPTVYAGAILNWVSTHPYRFDADDDEYEVGVHVGGVQIDYTLSLYGKSLTPENLVNSVLDPDFDVTGEDDDAYRGIIKNWLYEASEGILEIKGLKLGVSYQMKQGDISNTLNGTEGLVYIFCPVGYSIVTTSGGAEAYKSLFTTTIDSTGTQYYVYYFGNQFGGVYQLAYKNFKIVKDE